LIKAAAQNKINDFTPRVVAVGSSAATIGKIDSAYLEDETKLPFFFTRYANSKLMNSMFIKKLSEVVKDDEIIAHVVHPGFVSSGKSNVDFCPIAVVSMYAYIINNSQTFMPRRKTRCPNSSLK
jgi:NAD(P)-dependent dehydrogenase (short-subunit alcohol dehydrogenase family)